MASKTELASETQRGHNPAISKMPQPVWAMVAAHATAGITAAGKNAFTSAV
jgi:hypothetical protein